MIRVTVELLPLGNENPVLLGTVLIVNEGTGSGALGNYKVQSFRKTRMRVPGRALWFSGRATRKGEVWGYPRKARPIWSLVFRALKELGYS